MGSFYKGAINFINVAKALNITYINCPALKGGQLKIKHLLGFSPKLQVFRLVSFMKTTFFFSRLLSMINQFSFSFFPSHRQQSWHS